LEDDGRELLEEVTEEVEKGKAAATAVVVVGTGRDDEPQSSLDER